MRRIACVLALLIAAGASAGPSGLPQLGEHVFVPTPGINDPFPVTSVQTQVSLGRAAGTSVPVLDPSDGSVLGTAKADLMVAGIGFAYRHRVKDWLAVDVDLFTYGRIGTSTHTLLADGMTAALGYDIGWLIRIHESRKVTVSGSLNLSNRAGTFVNLVDWATGVVEGVDIPLVRSRASLGGSASGLAAWGISERFGLLGDLTMYYRESFDGKGINDWNADVRAAVSYDARRDLDVPLGLALSAGHSEDDDSTGKKVPIWTWALRLGLQGRDDFTIGLTFRQTHTTLVTIDSDMNLNELTIDMRYYF